MKSTDTFEHLTVNICKDDREVDIITKALKSTLAMHQWNYQNASTATKRNARTSADRAVIKTIALLKSIGQNTMADEVEYVLLHHTLTSKVAILSAAKEVLKEECLNHGITESKYKNQFAVLLEKAFVEQCDLHPLKEAPEWFDSSFEPMI